MTTPLRRFTKNQLTWILRHRPPATPRTGPDEPHQVIIPPNNTMLKQTNNTRIETLKEILADHLGVDHIKITEKSRLVEDLGADSLDMVELLMAIEEEWDIEVPDTKAEPIRTVGDILDGLTEQLGPEFPDDSGLLPLTEEQFIARYRPVMDREGYKQYEWPTDKLAILEAIESNKCWTAVTGDNGEFVIDWGNRMVNRIYNIITCVPVENENWLVQVVDEESEEPERSLKCVVPGHDSNGSPSLYFCEVLCSDDQYDEGAHYATAIKMAEDAGFDPSGIAYDDTDAAFGHFQYDWNTITSENRQMI